MYIIHNFIQPVPCRVRELEIEGIQANKKDEAKLNSWN